MFSVLWMQVFRYSTSIYGGSDVLIGASRRFALELQPVQDSVDGQSGDARGARRHGVIGPCAGRSTIVDDLSSVIVRESGRSSNHLTLIENSKACGYWMPRFRGA